MKEKKIKVVIEDRDRVEKLNVNIKSKICDVVKDIDFIDDKVLGFYVNNDLKRYDAELVKDSKIIPIRLSSGDGYRLYSRTLKMVLYMALTKLYASVDVKFLTTINRDQYFITQNIELTRDKITKIKDEMQRIIEKDLPITKRIVPIEEAMELYKDANNEDKLDNVGNRLKQNVSMYFCDGMYNYFYGSLAKSTGAVRVFDLMPYREGALLLMPNDNYELNKDVNVKKRLYDTFIDFNRLTDTLNIDNVGALNDIIIKGKINNVIQVAEAIHQRKMVELVQNIEKRKDKVKMILIAGPSSSGKTTFAQKLGVQLELIGLHPVTISMDNYFVERKDNPVGPDGKLDFECVEALDRKLFNSQMRDLIQGKTVELPRFDFIYGKKEYKGDFLKLNQNDVLIIEGIHALNPIMTEFTPDENKYKIYIAPIATLNIDGYTKVSSTDTRILRRMVRDYNTRGHKVEKTFELWQNVKKGEEKYIFPYVDTVDFVFNSSLIYEPSVMKTFAQPLLLQVDKDSIYYSEARRLYEYLNNFLPMETGNIPVDSIVREFIGNGCFYR